MSAVSSQCTHMLFLVTNMLRNEVCVSSIKPVYLLFLVTNMLRNEVCVSSIKPVHAHVIPSHKHAEE